MFALEQADKDTKEAAEIIVALKRLRQVCASDDPATMSRLKQLEADTLDVAARALATARSVAKRGHYATEDLPPLFRRRFVSKDGAKVALFSYPSGDIWDPRFATKFHAAVKGVDPKASGMAIDILEHEQMIIGGFARAAWLAAIMVFLLLLLVFRHVGHALLAMTPVLLGGLWMVGLMKLVGVSFNIANLIALPLVVGIGLDSGAHLVHRFRESQVAHGGIARLQDLVRGTGGAVLVSSVTTMIGFAALMAADYGAMFSLGATLVIGIGMTLLASLFVLPALIVILKLAR